jgi:predicted type IV restriction endonuclease
VEVKNFESAVPQVLAMLRAADVANLAKGFNISTYWGIITTGRMWMFIKLEASKDGYKVFQSEEKYWERLSQGNVALPILATTNGILLSISNIEASALQVLIV